MSKPPYARPGPSDSLRASFRANVLDRGEFSQNWFTGNIPRWEPILRPLEGRSANLLEIGAFEGLSTCYFLWRLRDATVTSIDTFAGSPEHHEWGIDVSGLEARFDRNVALVDAARVRKLVGDSRRVLLELETAHDRFDLVYIDGSHHALDVIVDAALSWRVLKTGGVAVFDDYRWQEHSHEPLLRPDTAIDAFLQIVAGCYELVFDQYQLAVRKTA